MDSKLNQILFGMANETCSIADFLAHMPAAGGSECRHFPRWPEEQHQIEVFWYPDGAFLPVQQKVARFLQSLEESDDWSKFMGIINLVQFWAPITSSGGETILSVWEQPFGVGRLSNGVFRYRYDCVGNPCSDDSNPISRAFMTGLSEYFQLRDHEHRYGIRIQWVLPLVEPPNGSCVGVLEFVSITVPSFEIPSLLTQSFLDSGPERFCENMVGTSFPKGQSFHKVPAQQNISDNFSRETMNVMSYDGPLKNASEDLRIVPYDEDHHVNMFADDHEFLNFAAPTNWGVTDEEQMQENLGGTNGQIEETSGMVQQLSLEPATDNAAAQLTSAPATSRKGKRVMTFDQLRGYFGRRQKDVADELGVHLSTIKRWCRSFGIRKWPSCRKRNKGAQNKGMDRPYSMSVKAKYGTCFVKFKIDSTIEFECLCQKLGDRFALEVGTFRIEYEDENGELIMIPCTEDLKGRLDFLNSSNKKTMDLKVSQGN